MLAPRKKLWSTPVEVLEAALNLLNLQKEDVLYDIGAGDGRVIFRTIEKTGARCVGIEMNAEAVEAIRERICDLDIAARCSIICGNALEQSYDDATCLFLYLVPRGLKLFFNEVIRKTFRCGQKIRIVSYMSRIPVEGLQPLKILKIATEAHPGALWPLYYYEYEQTSIDCDSAATTSSITT